MIDKFMENLDYQIIGLIFILYIVFSKKIKNMFMRINVFLGIAWIYCLRWVILVIYLKKTGMFELVLLGILLLSKEIMLPKKGDYYNYRDYDYRD